MQLSRQKPAQRSRLRHLALGAILVVAVTGSACHRKTVAVARRQCYAKELQGCLDLARLHWEGRLPGGAESTSAFAVLNLAMAIDKQRTLDAYQGNCDAGHPGACFLLGVLYDRGSAIDKLPPDRAKATTLFQKACDGGIATACVDVTIPNIQAGRGRESQETAKLLRRAAELRQKACDSGDLYACEALASSYAEGNEYISQDKGKAAELSRKANDLRQKACDSGDTYACNALAESYARGEERIPIDKDKATRLWRVTAELRRKACDQGDPTACDDLGDMYTEGHGVDKDPAAAARLREKACEAGYAPACCNLGLSYGTGAGVAKDAARAIQLYERACERRNAIGCANLGGLYFEGNGVPKDTARAGGYFKKACELGDWQGCQNFMALGGDLDTIGR